MSIKRFFAAVALVIIAVTAQAQSKNEGGEWVATWATATEFTGKGDMPKSGTLTNKAIRQIVHVSVGGKKMRLHLSN